MAFIRDPKATPPLSSCLAVESKSLQTHAYVLPLLSPLPENFSLLVPALPLHAHTTIHINFHLHILYILNYPSIISEVQPDARLKNANMVKWW